MIWFIVSGFALFFLNDWNDLRIANRSLRFIFFLGFSLVALGTVTACLSGETIYPLPIRIAAAAATLIFLILMLYSLFGAIPLKESYAEAGTKRPVCVVGVYALCRHPGVLWFIFLYLCLHFTFGMAPAIVAAAGTLNILLALFEDIVVFPHLLTGYADYKKTTPFLIPTGSSMRCCFDHYRRRGVRLSTRKEPNEVPKEIKGPHT